MSELPAEPMTTAPAASAGTAVSLSLGNIFRDAWEYRITADGLERLAARTGASPAFLAILALVSDAPASFRSIAGGMSHIDADDLELWLSAMCSMGLLAPAAPADGAVPVGDAAAASGAGAPAADTAVPAPDPVDEGLPLVLLVNRDARARANWRRALAGRGMALLECARLEVVETALRERKPAWVVLGLDGEDFEGLHLLRALRRPRAPRLSKVCLVVPRGRTLDEGDAATAARADARAASVADIVRAVCGDAALDTGEAEAPTGGADEPAPAAAASAKSAVPIGAPVWMNLLYGATAAYGGIDADGASVLEAQYPRLLVQLIEGWGQPGFERDLNALILDDRGDRHGFPPEVMEELWFLHRLHQDTAEALAIRGVAPAGRLASHSHA